jgi:His/Glu/Gln/Arg/opine family amino acid ABC transporter permease subunit
MGFVFDWQVITSNWQNFVNAALMTFYVAILSMLFAMGLGLVLALLRNAKSAVVQAPARIYVGFFRSLPLYVFLLWLYYGFKVAFGLGLQAVEAAVLALGLISAAYMSEIYRSGLMAVDRGQYEAGASIGLNRGQLYRKVILPQVFRTVLPASMNQFVGILKGATIVGIIGVFELMYFARTSAALTFKPFEFYTTAGVIFIVSTLVFAGLAGWLESRYRWRRA